MSCLTCEEAKRALGFTASSDIDIVREIEKLKEQLREAELNYDNLNEESLHPND